MDSYSQLDSNQIGGGDMGVVTAFIGFGFVLLLIYGWYTGFSDGQDLDE